MIRRLWRPDWPIDLDLVLGPMLRGRTDPMARRAGAQDWWLTGRTASGPMTLHVARAGPDVDAQAWGEGADGIIEALPVLLGDRDDPSGFEPGAGTVIAEQWRRHGARWRVPATGLVWECAVASVLEQKVTGQEARRGWYRLCREHGEPAPGPAPEAMFILPDREALAAIPSWWWRGAGVDHARAGTLMRLARTRLDGDVPRRLLSIPGVGPWTVAEVSFRALGDADAVSVGDFHLANLVGYALTGRPRSTDDQLLELLRPFAGHRYRAIRMIELAGIRPPRFGPRRTLPEHF